MKYDDLYVNFAKFIYILYHVFSTKLHESSNVNCFVFPSLGMTGDSMMYQHSVSGVGCSGGSPTTSTPPNLNACSSSTPPLGNNSQNQNQPSHNDNNGLGVVGVNEQNNMVRNLVFACVWVNCPPVEEMCRLWAPITFDSVHKIR